jgi:hypothetical protein
LGLLAGALASAHPGGAAAIRPGGARPAPRAGLVAGEVLEDAGEGLELLELEDAGELLGEFMREVLTRRTEFAFAGSNHTFVR